MFVHDSTSYSPLTLPLGCPYSMFRVNLFVLSPAKFRISNETPSHERSCHNMLAGRAYRIPEGQWLMNTEPFWKGDWHRQTEAIGENPTAVQNLHVLSWDCTWIFNVKCLRPTAWAVAWFLKNSYIYLIWCFGGSALAGLLKRRPSTFRFR
jgi:hypothetical protein